MTNMNELVFPMWDYRRVDGRYLQTARTIEFRNSNGRELFPTMTVDGREQLLFPGTIFGTIVRYRWRQGERRTWDDKRRVSDRSCRIHLQGQHSGQLAETAITVPGFKTKEPAALPVVDVKLWVNHPPYKLEVGQIALARLCENERAAIEEISFDHQAIMDEMHINPITDNPHPYLGTVQIGGLYVVRP